MLSDRAFNIIIYLVAGVWGINMFMAMIPGLHYQPEPYIHGIFMSIVGTALVAKSRERDPDREKQDGGDHRK